MVRVKNRYLVINYLYPAPLSSTDVRSTNDVPAVVQFNRPTPDKFDQRALREVIQDGVTELFGEYGSAMAGQGLKS